MTDLLRMSPLARILDAGRLGLISAFVTEVHGVEGTLIAQGQTPAGLYFLSAGVVEVRDSGTAAALARLEAPQVFGEMAFLTGGQASASVEICEPVSGVAISFAEMNRLLADEPEVGARVMTFLAKTLAHRLATTNRHLKRIEAEAQSERLGLSSLEDAQLEEGFSAEFASVNLDEVWDASFEL